MAVGTSYGFRVAVLVTVTILAFGLIFASWTKTGFQRVAKSTVCKSAEQHPCAAQGMTEILSGVTSPTIVCPNLDWDSPTRSRVRLGMPNRYKPHSSGNRIFWIPRSQKTAFCVQNKSIASGSYSRCLGTSQPANSSDRSRSKAPGTAAEATACNRRAIPKPCRSRSGAPLLGGTTGARLRGLVQPQVHNRTR